jgi:hypothetical protein
MAVALILRDELLTISDKAAFLHTGAAFDVWRVTDVVKNQPSRR